MDDMGHDPVKRAQAALSDGRRINDANALDMIDVITTLRAEVERLTRENAALREQTGELRMCLSCGKMRPAREGRGDLPDCEHPDYPGYAACMWQYTPQEAWEYWRNKAHELRDAVKVERERCARIVDREIDGPQDAPDVFIEWLARIAAAIRAGEREP